MSSEGGCLFEYNVFIYLFICLFICENTHVYAPSLQRSRKERSDRDSFLERRRILAKQSKPRIDISMMESQTPPVSSESEKLPDISEPSETEATVSSSPKSFEGNLPPPTPPSSSSSTSSTKPASKNKVSRKKSKKKPKEDTEIRSPSPKPPDLYDLQDSLDISDSPAASDISDLCGSSLGHSTNSQSANSSGHLDSPDMPRKYDKPVHVVSKFEEIICLICENNLKICGSSYTHIFKGQKKGGSLQGLPERISAFIGASDELKPNDVGSYYMCAQCQRNLQKGELLEKQVNQIREMFTSSFTGTSVNHRLKKRRINLNSQPQTSVEVKQLQIRIKVKKKKRKLKICFVFHSQYTQILFKTLKI